MIPTLRPGRPSGSTAPRLTPTIPACSSASRPPSILKRLGRKFFGRFCRTWPGWNRRSPHLLHRGGWGISILALEPPSRSSHSAGGGRGFRWDGPRGLNGCGRLLVCRRCRYGSLDGFQNLGEGYFCFGGAGESQSPMDLGEHLAINEAVSVWL